MTRLSISHASSALRRAVLPFAGFCGLAIVFSWPLATSPFTTVIGHAVREGVPPLNTWAMATVWRNLFVNPGAVLHGTAFYPYDNTVAFSEHLLVPAIMSGPVAALSGSWTLAYNASIFTALVLGAFFTFLAAKEIGLSSMAAFLAGGLYAFNSWNINEVVRSQILSNEFFPLLLFACLRFASTPSWRRAAAVGAAALLQALSCMYWAVYLPFFLIPLLLILLGARFGPLARVGAALALAGLLTLAFVWPYVEYGQKLGQERPEPTSVPVDRYLQVLPQNLLYGSVLEHGLANQNAAHFQGFAALALGVPGAWLLRRRNPRLTAALGLLAVFSFVASLGPEIWIAGRRLGPGLYAALFEYVPLFRHIRYPERFAIFVNLSVAVFAAAGLDTLRSKSRTAAALVLGFALFEHLSIPQFLDTMPATDVSREVYSAIAALPDDAVVAEVPASRYRMERRDAGFMFESIGHGKRIVEGFTGFFPPLYALTKWHLFNYPSPRTLKFLSDLGVDTLVDRTGSPVPEGATVVGTFGDARLLRLPTNPKGSFMNDTFVAKPEMEEIARDGWEIRLPEKEDDGGRLMDGDPRTWWSTREGQTRAAFVRVRFRSAERLGRIRLLLPLTEFPVRFRVEGVVDSDKSPFLVYDEDWAFTSLARSLWKTPRAAVMDIDVEPALVSGFRIRVTEDDPFRVPITISEIRAYRAP